MLGKTKLELRHPVEIPSQGGSGESLRVTELLLDSLRAEHIWNLKMSVEELVWGDAFEIGIQLSHQPRTVIKALHVADAMRLGKMVMGFFEAGLVDGDEPPTS